MARPTNASRIEEQEREIEALRAELAALRAAQGRPTPEVLPDATWTELNPTDADILREKRRGNIMRTPTEVNRLEQSGVILAGPQPHVIPHAPRPLTTFAEDGKGNIVVSKTMESAPVPPETGRTRGREIDNTGEMPVETEGLV